MCGGQKEIKVTYFSANSHEKIPRAHTSAKAQQCIIELSSHISNHLNTPDSFHWDLWIIPQETNKHVKAIRSENGTESEKKKSWINQQYMFHFSLKGAIRDSGGRQMVVESHSQVGKPPTQSVGVDKFEIMCISASEISVPPILIIVLQEHDSIAKRFEVFDSTWG